jgi:hypothetical protein
MLTGGNDEPRSAKLLASVPPEVKITAPPCPPTSSATAARPPSMTRRASRPKAWTEDAFPVTRSASATASTTWRRTGAVAL